MNKGAMNAEPREKEKPIDCLCGDKVLPSALMSHVKLCNNFKVVFGSLPDTIDISLRAAKDTASVRVLYYLFNEAKMLCRNRIKAADAVKEPSIPKPVPILPILPQPDGHIEKPQPMDIEEKKEVKKAVDACPCTMMMEEDSVFCKICSTRFFDFNLIIYLQRCLHAFCKEDLRKLIFRYRSRPATYS